VESLNSRDSPAMGWVTTGVKAFDASGVLASLPGQCAGAMNVDFGEMKRMKTLMFLKISKEGRKISAEDSLKKERNISLEKDCKSPIYRCLVGEIEDQGVNFLFDSKKNYSGSIILSQERGDIQAQISLLFKAGFLMWRWKVNLVFR